MFWNSYIFNPKSLVVFILWTWFLNLIIFQNKHNPGKKNVFRFWGLEMHLKNDKLKRKSWILKMHFHGFRKWISMDFGNGFSIFENGFPILEMDFQFLEMHFQEFWKWISNFWKCIFNFWYWIFMNFQETI